MNDDTQKVRGADDPTKNVGDTAAITTDDDPVGGEDLYGADGGAAKNQQQNSPATDAVFHPDGGLEVTGGVTGGTVDTRAADGS